MSQRQLEKKADRLFGEKVRSRGYCQKCGSKEVLQCAHIISRRYKQVRWNLKNAMCICRRHHVYYTSHPIEWENFVIEEIGEEEYNDLRKKALDYKEIDYQEILDSLQ